LKSKITPIAAAGYTAYPKLLKQQFILASSLLYPYTQSISNSSAGALGLGYG
jgi:hypothetical protein